MITKKEILDAIHGKMIISCQAVEDEPLYVEEKSIMYLMARAAKQAGTPAIRTSRDRKSTRLNSSHVCQSRMPSSA